MKKLFWGAVIPLMLSMGFTACSKYDFNDENGEDGEEVSTKATTYMSVSFTLPTSNDTRSYNDGQDKDDPDFNNVGKWHGKDKIKSVNVYVFKIIDGIRGELEVIHKYAASDLGFTQKSISNKTLITPNKAFKVTPGEKAVYVVVNPTQAAEDLLTVPKQVPSSLGLDNTPKSPKELYVFDEFYHSSLMQFSTSATLTEEYTTGDKTRAGEIAKVEDGKDVILMTGDEVYPTIDDNVSATEAVSGYKNRPEISVKRAVARVLVTTAATSFDFKGVNPNNGNIEASAIKVSNLTYVVAQGENKFHFYDGDGHIRFYSPAYEIAPSNDDYWTENFQANYQDVGSHYDYSGLWKNTAGSSAKVKGITVPTRTVFNANAAGELTNVTNDLNEGLKGEFILPTLHTYNTDRKLSKYRKGNTAYILVRGFLTPKYVVQADGSVVDGATLPANADLYLGTNGVFYANQATVRNTAKKGVAGQTAQLFKARKVLYFAWINPDNLITNKVVNSPVSRNNIYHVQIKGISKVGANWNPLVPTLDPHNPKIADPNDPDNPINKNPINPDPRPDNNPYEPKDPPVNPQDHLSIQDTWMSVNVAILPWAVHSYEIEF